jgi:enamine deaminase RidA (YjgF/YER057c/UK114 family)
VQSTIYDWLGHEWIMLRAEGSPALGPEAQTSDIFARIAAGLEKAGLSLDDTLRTRLWARDRDARDRGSRARVASLTGNARSASSSFIAPDYFDSGAAVAVEVWAMKPATQGSTKNLLEYDPPIVPLRYLIREGVLVLSGVTSVLPTLDAQVEEIVTAVEGSLERAGSGWSQVVRIASHLHHSQTLADLRSLLKPVTERGAAELEFGFVDGYSTPGKLVEIEVTAQLDSRR